MLLMLTAVVGLTTFTIVSAGWGFVATFVAEVVKQDGLPKLANTALANAVVIVSAVLATFTQATFNWNNFASALIAAGAAAVVGHQFVITPTGLGDWLQSLTSVLKAPTAAPAPVAQPPAAAPIAAPEVVVVSDTTGATPAVQ